MASSHYSGKREIPEEDELKRYVLHDGLYSPAECSIRVITFLVFGARNRKRRVFENSTLQNGKLIMVLRIRESSSERRG